MCGCMWRACDVAFGWEISSLRLGCVFIAARRECLSKALVFEKNPTLAASSSKWSPFKPWLTAFSTDKCGWLVLVWMEALRFGSDLGHMLLEVLHCGLGWHAEDLTWAFQLSPKYWASFSAPELCSNLQSFCLWRFSVESKWLVSPPPNTFSHSCKWVYCKMAAVYCSVPNHWAALLSTVHTGSCLSNQNGTS